MTPAQMRSVLEKIAANLEKSLDRMATISTQNAELRTLVLALQERLAHVEASHGERIAAVEGRIPVDRGIGRSP
jgi:hypothetical protein